MSEWKEDTLENLVFVDKEQLSNLTDSEYSFYYIDISSVSTNKIQFPDAPITFRGSPSRARKILHDGDVLMATVRPNLKAFAKFIRPTKRNYIASTGFAVLSKKENADLDYIYHSLFSNSVEKQIETLVVGSNYPALNTCDIRKLKILAPSLPIQHHISRILSTVDVVIEKTQAAIFKYKAIKQGMLHDLFTRGIDITTGKLRPKYEDVPELYKESKLGMVPKEWEVDSIENISKRIWIGLVTTMTTHYVKHGIPLIRNNNIRDNYIDNEDMIQLDKTFSENNAQRYLHEGDIVTVHTGDIGTSAIINKNFDPAHGFATINTTVNAKIINNELLCYYFNSIEFKNRIEMYATGDGRSNLNLYDFLYILISFPKNIDEQKLIVERLNSLNQKLHTEQIYLHKLQQIKAGLMGDLLSGKKKVTTPEEVLTQTEN